MTGNVPLDMDRITMDELYKHYPKGCFPTTLRPPNARSNIKDCEFEKLIDSYEPDANCVAFRTSAARLPYWVCALWSYFYDHLGKKDEYDVNWDDDPSDMVTNLQSISIEFHSKNK